MEIPKATLARFRDLRTTTNSTHPKYSGRAKNIHPSADYSNTREQFKSFSQIDAIRLKSDLRDESEPSKQRGNSLLNSLDRMDFCAGLSTRHGADRKL